MRQYFIPFITAAHFLLSLLYVFNSETGAYWGKLYYDGTAFFICCISFYVGFGRVLKTDCFYFRLVFLSNLAWFTYFILYDFLSDKIYKYISVRLGSFQTLSLAVFLLFLFVFYVSWRIFNKVIYRD